MKVTLNYNKHDKIIALALASLVMLPSFNFYLNNILIYSLGLPSVSLLLYLVLIVVSLYACSCVLKKKQCNRVSIFVAAALIFLSILSYILYEDSIGYILISPDFNPIYSQAIFLVFFCIPALILSNSCNNWSLVLRYISLVSPLVVSIGFLAYYLTGFSTWGEGTMDYMTLSYNTLTAGCFCFYNFVKRLSLVHLFFALLSFFIILAAGCRGALVCMLFSIMFQIYYNLKNKPHSKSSHYITLGIVVLVCLFIFGATLDLNVIIRKFAQLGIDSRSLTMLTEKTFFEDDARNALRDAVWEGLTINPLGYGLFGDRYITAKFYVNGADYVHNFFFEMWAHWGLVLGSVAMFVLFRNISIVLFRKSMSPNNIVLILLIPYGLIRLFFSSSYLIDLEFFIILGILFGRNKKCIK